MSTFYILRSEEDLTHHGIKDQRWGIRRFQNPDGTLTEAGRLRYRKSESGTSDRKSNKSSSSEKKEPRKMTNQELQEAINRFNLEQQYSKIRAEEASKGRDYVREVLKIGGTALVAAGSVYAIAEAISKAKGNSSGAKKASNSREVVKALSGGVNAAEEVYKLLESYIKKR